MTHRAKSTAELPPPEPPRTLTVILVDSGPNNIALAHENEFRPFVRRTVQIDLTDEQRDRLRPRFTCTLGSRPIYETVERVWFEPVDPDDVEPDTMPADRIV